MTDTNLATTREWVGKFEKSIREHPKDPPENVHPEIHAASLEAMKSQLLDLKNDLIAHCPCCSDKSDAPPTNCECPEWCPNA